jgi:transposase
MNGNEACQTAIASAADVFVGIDVSKLKLDVARLRLGKVRNKVFGNDRTGFRALAAWLGEDNITPSQAHICMEATGPYSEALAVWLSDEGWLVSVVNPARVKGFAQSELTRNKTDKADAALLARFCSALAPERWCAPSPAVRQLRSLVERLQALKDMHQQEMNRMEAANASDDQLAKVYIAEHVNYLEAAIKRLQSDIDDHIAGQPELSVDAKLLTSIPGLGNVTVAKVLAYAGDISRFDSAKALSAFAGVCPQQRLSGTSVKGRTLVSKRGHADLRKALYMPGMVAMRYNPLIKEMAQRLKAKGMVPKAIIAAAMHKLAHLIYGVLKTRQPFDANWAKRATEVIETAVSVAVPVKINAMALDFQDGI